MTDAVAAAAVLVLLSVAAAVGLRTGFARMLFFRLFAWVKGEDLLAPTVQHNPPHDSPYQRWLAEARGEIPVLERGPIEDIFSLTLSPWPQLGQGIEGVYLHFADYQMADARVIGIPAGSETREQRHLYEQGVYVVHGEGHTVLRQEGKQPQTIEWRTGDLLSVPLNVRHRHRNTGAGSARLLIVTSFPLVLNTFNNGEFIETNGFAFTDRYDGAADFPEYSSELDRLELAANFVRDVRTTPARRNDFRGKGNESIRWLMAGNSMLSMHISELPPGLSKKAHRITSNGFVLILTGRGVTVQWREGAYKQRTRIDWKPGTLFSPPVFWYQQHLNSGASAARYLVINVPGFVRNIGLHFEDQLEVDIPEVAREWKAELEKPTPS